MRLPIFLAAVLISLLLFTMTTCKRTQDPIIVNVLRNEKSRSFEVTERKLLRFESLQPKTDSGRPIVVQSILMNDAQFDNILADQQRLSMMKPDLIVLSSPDQAKAILAAQEASVAATNVCGTVVNCPAFIPRWVSGEKLDAARLVLSSLSSSS